MTAGKTVRESPVAFRGWALMLGNAAHLLEGLWTGYSLPTNNEPGRATKQAACASGGVILRALSVELALKFLAYLRTARHAFGHDLWDLYLDLDDETRSIVEAVDRRTSAGSPFPPVADILKDNRDAFVSFRYPALPMTGPSWLALGRAHDVILEAIDDPDFRQLCPETTHE